MTLHHHVFHTKHDFTPEFAWAAFQLLAELEPEGISASELLEIAKAVASPLAKRADLSKLLGAFQELGLINRTAELIFLSSSGRALADNLGRYENGFNAVVHCLYIWKWLLDGDEKTASPSWSYREVCRQIRNAGVVGITADEIVLRIVTTAAEHFGAEKISFSRSSVTGVTAWLESQMPPLIKKDNQRLFKQEIFAAPNESIRLHLAMLCAIENCEAELNSRNVRLLAEALLASNEEALLTVLDFANESPEFILTDEMPRRVVLNRSNEPFINWIINQKQESKRWPQHNLSQNFRL